MKIHEPKKDLSEYWDGRVVSTKTVEDDIGHICGFYLTDVNELGLIIEWASGVRGRYHLANVNLH